jgi:NAD(P)-dependent dehydrogenase (short-subunit alcohol dehydrogenase family)
MRIVLLGATSSIATAAARIWAAKGAAFHLVAKDPTELEAVAADLVARGGSVSGTRVFDFTDSAQHDTAMREAFAGPIPTDIVLVAHGWLPPASEEGGTPEAVRNCVDINFTSAASLLTHAAAHMERQGHGRIAVISSVAGDRGRASNYVYGSAKAGLTAFADGLRGRMLKANVSVTLLKPGYVDTPMTSAHKKGLLFISPARAGALIVRAIERRKDVAYVPWFWWWIMLVIRMIPESIFKKLKL